MVYIHACNNFVHIESSVIANKNTVLLFANNYVYTHVYNYVHLLAIQFLFVFNKINFLSS